MTTGKDHFQEDIHKKPEELQREADDVRADVEHTMEELMNQLSPGELINQAIKRFRSGGDNAFVHNLSTQIQNNPVPAVLTGAGLIWLMSASKQPPAKAAHSGDGVSQGVAGAKDRLSSAAGQARSSAQALKQQARDRKNQMAAGATDLKERASNSARSARDGYQQLLSEQPLVVGALAIAAGAALGAMFPRTQGENRALGDISDQQTQALKHKAEGMAEKAEEKVQEQLHQQRGDTGGAANRSSATEADARRDASSSPTHTQGQTQGQSAVPSPSSPYNPPAGASGHPGSVRGGAGGYEPPPLPRDADSRPDHPGINTPASDRPYHRP